MRSFGETLSVLLQEKKMSSKDLASATGLSERVVYALEKDKRMPTIPELVTIGNYFNVSYDYLIGRSESRLFGDILELSEGNEVLGRVLQLLRLLPEDRLNALQLALQEKGLEAFIEEQEDQLRYGCLGDPN